LSVTPTLASRSSWWRRKGRSTTGTTGLGTVSVRGRSRVPSPPTRITAFMESLSPWAGRAADDSIRRLRVRSRTSQEDEVSELATRLEERLRSGEARLGTLGLGYVGLPLSVEFATGGLSVTGFDLSKEKVDAVNRGESYIKDVPPSR